MTNAPPGDPLVATGELRVRSRREPTSYAEMSKLVRAPGLKERRRGCYAVKLCVLAAALASTGAVAGWLGDLWWQLRCSGVRTADHPGRLPTQRRRAPAGVLLRAGERPVRPGAGERGHRAEHLVVEEQALPAPPGAQPGGSGPGHRGGGVGLTVGAATSRRSRLTEASPGAELAAPNLRRAREVVRPFCAARGVPYAEVDSMTAYVTVARHLNRVGLRARETFQCPLVAA